MISVMMTNYNTEKYLPAAIESVLAQTFTDFELLIVDDGSTDGSLEIIRSYMEKDERIRLIEIEHGGIVKARNTALDAARYPWVAILDSDDVALPERLEKQVAAIETNPDVVAWSAYAYRINSEGHVYSTAQTGPLTVDEFQQARNRGEFVMLLNNAMIYRTDIARKAGGYNPHFVVASDMELLDRMAAYGSTLTIPEYLVYYRMHTGSATVSRKKLSLQRRVGKFLRLRNQYRLMNRSLTWPEFLELDSNEGLLTRFLTGVDNLSAHHLRLGAVLLGEKQYASAGKHMMLSFVFNPTYVTYRVWNRLTGRQSFDNGAI